jgi:putative ABC transport system permease protein
MKAKIDEWYAAQHFQAVVLTSFAALALVICLSGLYAVISHSVSRRTAEIGIRHALGAEPRQTVLLMMREGVWLIMSGTVTGIFLAVILARLLRSFLYQVQPTDLPTFTLVVLSVCTMACLAMYVPSRRAARIDPMSALRAS